MADGNFQKVSEVRVRSGFGVELDAATLMRARSGEMPAFAAIYNLFGAACHNLALGVLGEPAMAADVVQDVFLKLFDRIGSYRGEAPFGAWLKRLTANAIVDVLRSARHIRGDDADVLIANVADTCATAEQRVDARNLLLRLKPRARAVVVLHELEGYSHKEIAALFGQSESYSKSILARALQQLQSVSARPTNTQGQHDA